MYWKRRHVGIGAVVHLETRVRTPWRAIVGWLYTRYGATVASSDPRAGEGTREGWLLGDGFRRYWDRSNIPQSAQKANEMWDNRKLVLF